MKAYVTDTHPLIWYSTKKPRKLSRKVLKIFSDCEAGQGLIYIPVAVLWEISLLLRADKIEMDDSLKGWYENLLIYKTFVVVSLEPELVFEAHDIDLPENKDPFDRIIVASALMLDCPLITVDERIQTSGLVETIW